MTDGRIKPAETPLSWIAAAVPQGRVRCRNCPVRNLCKEEARWLVRRVKPVYVI